MKWKKLGLIYCAHNDSNWRYQWSMLPTPIVLNDDIIRVFVSFCDRETVGRIGYVDVAADDPTRIIEISPDPVLDIGRDGCFDDNGVVPISVLQDEDGLRLYYIGFCKGVKVPYYMFCGLAISKDNGKSFSRYSESPVLDRINDEVYARCGVNIIKDGKLYKMWYIGSQAQGWTLSQGKLKPLYIMKHTTSDDGLHWNRATVVCMNYANKDEHGFGRPFVWKENEKYKMYYCIRTYSRGYYIGYAESEDGATWVRKDDEAGITLSESGWDCENMSYPYLLSVKGRTFMFYNGNGCGKSGFGCAELVIE